MMFWLPGWLKLYYLVCWCGISPLLLLIVIIDSLQRKWRTPDHLQGKHRSVFGFFFKKVLYFDYIYLFFGALMK